MSGSPRWSFERDELGLWRWACIEAGSRTVSPGSFDERAQCVLDAIRHAVQRRRLEAEAEAE